MDVPMKGYIGLMDIDEIPYGFAAQVAAIAHLVQKRIVWR